MGETGLKFGVLGPFPFGVEGNRAAGRYQTAGDLAMLVINRNRWGRRRESLINAVWDQSPGAGSARPASSPMYPTCAASSATRNRRAHGAGQAHRRGIELTVADADCDLGPAVVEKSADAHAAAAGRGKRPVATSRPRWPNGARPFLDRAAAVRGVVEAFATALMEDKVLAHAARAEAEIACGRRLHAVIGELEALTGGHPYREPLWAQLITAYYVAERQSDALEAYRQLKSTLAQDLGIDPGAHGPCPARTHPAPGAAGHPAGGPKHGRRHHRPGNLNRRSAVGGQSVLAGLRDTAGDAASAARRGHAGDGRRWLTTTSFSPMTT